MFLALSSDPAFQPPPVAVADEYISPEGHRTRWASVTYTLPDGQIAEVVMIADDANRGDGYVYVEGEAVVHSSWNETGGVHTWTSSAPGASAQALAALTSLPGEAGDELFDAFTTDSEAFKCSEWGKKVLNASRYIWAGVVGAGMAACCVAGGPACIPCAGGLAAVGLYGDDQLTDYGE
ncbi:hypothetical protein DB30_03400 [Enhygromyxa salina]|uniref:Uncharacterized protein n=1 Tax=Enhygromyxa salina TaxID=215803 RepID=A0A0C2A1U1_9BACT|nr:hypothetical protein DB30_03400 [Enhygromyxa salina]